jgi:hypothetical protein
MSDLEQELLEAEREGWRALASGRAGEHYRQHLGGECSDGFPVWCHVKAGSDRCNGGRSAVVELRPGRSSGRRVVWRRRHCGVSGERTAGWREAVCGDRQQHVRPPRRTVAAGIPSAVARLILNIDLTRGWVHPFSHPREKGHTPRDMSIKPSPGRRHHPHRRCHSPVRPGVA